MSQLKLVNKFDNLNRIKMFNTFTALKTKSMIDPLIRANN